MWLFKKKHQGQKVVIAPACYDRLTEDHRRHFVHVPGEYVTHTVQDDEDGDPLLNSVIDTGLTFGLLSLLSSGDTDVTGSSSSVEDNDFGGFGGGDGGGGGAGGDF